MVEIDRIPFSKQSHAPCLHLENLGGKGLCGGD